jgi:HEAT repeat protein
MIGSAMLVVAALSLTIFLLLPSELDQKLKDLKALDAAKSTQALEWLAEAEPQDAQRAKVTAALEPLLVDGDPHKNLDTDLLLRTYLSWADTDNVPAMIRMVRNATLPHWSTTKTGLVMEALGKLQDVRAAEALAEKLPSSALHDQAVNALELLGPRAEKVVMDYVFHPDAGTRDRAGQLLKEYGTFPETIATEALNRLRSPQANLRNEALVWFVDNPPPDEAKRAEAAPLLARLLDDSSKDVRLQALGALKRWATPDCLPQLLEYSRRQQNSSTGNPSLIDVLAQFRDPVAAEALALQLPNSQARPRAARALMKLGPVAAGAVLPFLNHPDDGVQKAAEQLTRQLNIPSGRQLDQVLSDIADSDATRSCAALQYLAQLRPDEANRAKVSQALNAPLLDVNSMIRDDALKAVRAWGTTANTDTLLKLLADFQKSGGGRGGRIIEVLGSLHDPRAAPALAQALTYYQERGVASQALKSLGPAAEPAVLPYLNSLDRATRYEACLILSEVGTSKSVQPIRIALDQSSLTDYPFSEAAWRALENIKARQ